LPRSFIQLTIAGTHPFDRFNILFDEPEIALSRLYTHPPVPRHVGTEMAKDKFVLKTGPFASHYKNEVQTAVRWRVIDLDWPGFPVLDVIEREAGLFNLKTVPIVLDSGRYYWEAAAMNNFGKWSGFSAPCTLNVARNAPCAIVLKEAWFSKSGKSRPIRTLHPEKWYDLNIRMHTDSDWSITGYLIAQLNHPSYTFGNPSNKAGHYYPESNYVINISFPRIFYENTGYSIFEKHEKALSSRRLEPGTTGEYLDITETGFSFDSLSGLLKIKFKLKEKALKGDWLLISYMIDREDNRSPLFRLPFKVAETGKAVPAWPWVLVVLLVAAVLIIKMAVKRPSGAAKPEFNTRDSELMAIVDWINGNIGEELTLNVLQDKLNITVHQWRKIIGRNKIESFSWLLNYLRIEKAKALMRDPGLQISEIGYKVGFADPKYFSKIFRDFEGVTPREFRKN
jgi:AraC-like DNA-binding protein